MKVNANPMTLGVIVSALFLLLFIVIVTIIAIACCPASRRMLRKRCSSVEKSSLSEDKDFPIWGEPEMICHNMDGSIIKFENIDISQIKRLMVDMYYTTGWLQKMNIEGYYKDKKFCTMLPKQLQGDDFGIDEILELGTELREEITEMNKSCKKGYHSAIGGRINGFIKYAQVKCSFAIMEFVVEKRKLLDKICEENPLSKMHEGNWYVEYNLLRTIRKEIDSLEKGEFSVVLINFINDKIEHLEKIINCARSSQPQRMMLDTDYVRGLEQQLKEDYLVDKKSNVGDNPGVSDTESEALSLNPIKNAL